MCFDPNMRDLREAFRMGAEAAALVTATFKKPIELEFEKVYCPLLLVGKKRSTSFLEPHNLLPFRHGFGSRTALFLVDHTLYTTPVSF